jgi:hypothetical protein
MSGAKDIEAGPKNPEAGEGEPKEGEDGEQEIKGEPRTFQQKAASHNISVTQYQVEEVIGIMRENVEKVLERDAKLGEMEERAETLYEGASAFQKSAGSLKNKMWLANLKQTIIMVIIGVILLALGSKYFGMW